MSCRQCATAPDAGIPVTHLQTLESTVVVGIAGFGDGAVQRRHLGQYRVGGNTVQSKFEPLTSHHPPFGG